MDNLAEEKVLLKKIRRQLEDVYTTATSADSQDGALISDSEKQTIEILENRIDKIEAHIKELEAKGGTSIDNQLSYDAIKNRKWSWKLVDKDVVNHDLGGKVDILYEFGKVQRGQNSYWILYNVRHNVQSTTGLKIDIGTVESKYLSLQGKLVFTINFEFTLTTSEITKSSETTLSGSLEASQQQKIAVALPSPQGEVSGETSAGVKAGLNVGQKWTTSKTLSAAQAMVSRQFTCINDGKGGLKIEVTNKTNPDYTGIDTGHDYLGAEEWEVTVNDDSFAGSL